MLNCKQATRLVSQGLDRKLGLSQRLGLGLHLVICHWCRDYARQLRFLHRIAPAIEAHIEGQQAQTLSPEAKAKIAAELGRRLDGH